MSRTGPTPPPGESQPKPTPSSQKAEGSLESHKVEDSTNTEESKNKYVPQYNFRNPGGKTRNASRSWPPAIEMLIRLIEPLIRRLLFHEESIPQSDQEGLEMEEVTSEGIETRARERKTARVQDFAKEWEKIKKEDLKVVRQTRMIDFLNRLDREFKQNPAAELDNLRKAVVKAMVQDLIAGQGPEYFKAKFESMVKRQAQQDPTQLFRYYADTHTQIEDKIKELKKVLNEEISERSPLWKPLNNQIKALENENKRASRLFAIQIEGYEEEIEQLLKNNYHKELDEIAVRSGLQTVKVGESFKTAINRMLSEAEEKEKSSKEISERKKYQQIIRELKTLASGAVDFCLDTQELTILVRLTAFQQALKEFKKNPEGPEKTFISNYILRNRESIKESMKENVIGFAGGESANLDDKLSQIILNVATRIVLPE